MAERVSDRELPLPDSSPDGSNKWDFITEEFLRSSPLPPQEVIDELNAKHLELLDELDEEFGPPSEEDVQWAEAVMRRLGLAPK